jgi:ring-1,2-phenylacetyl-CoA epoxidase subunit PaaB
MNMDSLDPRVKRLQEIPAHVDKKPLDQFSTYQVFVQPKEGKPFQHEGIVHAPNLEMAYVLAKEAFTRRFLCVSLAVADTRNIHVSPVTEGTENVFARLPATQKQEDPETSYEIYVQPRRGKQHIHTGKVSAPSAVEAMRKIETAVTGKPVCNIWAIQTSDFRFTNEQDRDLWLTLPEKKFRDATDYKGGEKLKSFLEKSKT